MQHFISSYGYLAVFVLMVAESACIPIPSELIMTFGGALAAGAVPGTKLNLIAVIAAGVAGNVVGSYLAWAVGRYGGQTAVRRWGRRAWLSDRELDRANAWFARHGSRAVLIGRVLPAVRTFISLPAGLAGMAPLRFGIYTTLGCIPWTAALAYAGYAVGANWQSIVNGFKLPTYIFSALIIVALVILAWRYVRRRRAEQAAGAAGGQQRLDRAGQSAGPSPASQSTGPSPASQVPARQFPGGTSSG